MSLNDYMYWEKEFKKETKQKELLKQQNSVSSVMPCYQCDIKDMCKYAFSVNITDYNKELFNIDITCKSFREKPTIESYKL